MHKCEVGKEDDDDNGDGDLAGEDLGAALLVDQPLLAPAEPVPHKTLGHVHPVDVLRIARCHFLSHQQMLQLSHQQKMWVEPGGGNTVLWNRFLVIAPPVSTHSTLVWVAGEDVGGGQDLSSPFYFERNTWLDMTIPFK